MARFPITRTRRLPPAVGPGVRAALDVRTGEAAIGQALAQAGGALAGLATSIIQKEQQMEDATAAVISRQIRTVSGKNQIRFMDVTADPKLWAGNIDELEAQDRAALAEVDFGTSALQELEDARLTEHYATLRATTEIAKVRKIRDIMLKLTKGDVVEAHASGDLQKIKNAEENYLAGRKGVVNLALAKQELNRLRAAGDARRIRILATAGVQAALAATIVEEEGKTVIKPIGEGLDILNQLDLPIEALNAARSGFTAQYNARQRQAKEALDAQQFTDDKEILRKIYSPQPGEILTFAEIQATSLDPDKQSQRWREYQSAKTVADADSDPFANMRAIEAANLLGEGTISKTAALDRVGRELNDLDKNDREARLADVAQAFDKAKSTVLRNAFSNSRLLMSRIFVGVTDQAAFNLLFTGMSPTEKADLNRRFVAEMTNRSLYNTSVRDAIRENPDITIADLRTEAGRRLVIYQQRTLLNLEEFERQVVIERNFRLREPVPEQKQTLKPVKDMSDEERHRQLQRINAKQGR